MVSALQTSLTQKLVPLLSKIRTKEPAVTVSLALVGLLPFEWTWRILNGRMADGHAPSTRGNGYESRPGGCCDTRSSATMGHGYGTAYVKLTALSRLLFNSLSH